MLDGAHSRGGRCLEPLQRNVEEADANAFLIGEGAPFPRLRGDCEVPACRRVCDQACLVGPSRWQRLESEQGPGLSEVLALLSGDRNPAAWPRGVSGEGKLSADDAPTSRGSAVPAGRSWRASRDEAAGLADPQARVFRDVFRGTVAGMRGTRSPCRPRGATWRNTVTVRDASSCVAAR